MSRGIGRDVVGALAAPAQSNENSQDSRSHETQDNTSNGSPRDMIRMGGNGERRVGGGQDWLSGGGVVRVKGASGSTIAWTGWSTDRESRGSLTGTILSRVSKRVGKTSSAASNKSCDVNSVLEVRPGRA